MTNRQQKLIENYIRRKVKSVLKENYDATDEANNLISHANQYLNDEIDLKLFAKLVRDTSSVITDNARKFS